MYALQLKFLYTTLLIAASLGLNDAVANGRSRRRFGPVSSKLSTNADTEKPLADQYIAATTNTESNKIRRGGAYSIDAADYIYNTADFNFIQPENKPLHTKITAKYTSSITIPHDSIEDTETAEEYVAKAMGMYGSRLREPIRVPYEPQPTQAEDPQQHLHQHLQHQQNEQEHQQLENQPKQQTGDQKANNYDYYTYTQKEIPQQSYTTNEEQTGSQTYNTHPSQPGPKNDPTQQLKEHLQGQLQEQMQQAQQLVKDREQKLPQAEQNEVDESPAPVYEKEPVTRSYNIYEEHTEGYEPAQQSEVDRNYHTKYIYKPVPQYQENNNENEERIRVSASTEIPKAEIMKQIEKSVIKYMKELEAEGKIIAAPQRQEAKTYFKVITVPGSDEKRIGSTTVKPSKYISNANSNYQESYKHHSIPAPQKYHKNPAPKSNYQTENENPYQASAHEVAELTPNVEFIYKIKTKAPLHTATVKTVSKPYNLPIKSYEQFDHSSALKNLEEFDLSHVVTTPDPEEHQSASSSNKPNKLYFNSEVYHDINSLPYKQKQRAEAEYRKLKAAADNHPDYKGYSAGHAQSGYYAEPPTDHEADRETSSSSVSEDGYPLMNPYQHVLKKEPIPSKYDDSNASYEQQQPRSHKYKPLEFDNYNPKFNNNPEGYGYQQTYRTQLSTRHAPGKRGKRGGGSLLPTANKKSTHRAALKDYEANVALRPPPKN